MNIDEPKVVSVSLHKIRDLLLVAVEKVEFGKLLHQSSSYIRETRNLESRSAADGNQKPLTPTVSKAVICVRSVSTMLPSKLNVR